MKVSPSYSGNQTLSPPFSLMKSVVVVMNNKRRRSEDEEDRPSKAARTASQPTHRSSEKGDESTDLNNPAWDMQRLREPEEFFAHVQNKWRPKSIANPHTNFTLRHSGTTLTTGFRLPGSNEAFVHCATIYDGRVKVILNSLSKVRKEIVALELNRRYLKRKDRSRINFLQNYRSQLRNELRKLDSVKCSAESLYYFYYDSTTGRDARSITTKQMAEAKHLRKIVDSFKMFYGYSS